MVRLRDIDEARELVRAEVNLEDVVRHYGVELRGVGATHLKAICPFHTGPGGVPEKEPSFSIAIQKQLYFCHGCKRGGDVFKFVQLRECVGHGEAIEILARFVGFDLGPYRRDPTPEEKAQERLYAVNRAVFDSLDPVDVIKWPVERAFDVATLETYGISYSASLPTVGPGNGEQRRSLQLDWRDKWEHVVVIPLRDTHGRIAGFRCRTKGGKGRPLGPKEDHPLPVPPIYGLFEARAAIRDAGFVVVIEGESDVWQMCAHGWANVVGMMGSKFGEEEIEYLIAAGVHTAVLLPDGDKAGRELALRVASTHRKQEFSIKVASLEDGDPDEVLLRDPEEIEAALRDAVFSFEYLIRRVLSGHVVESMTDKVDALTELRPYFSVAPAYERDLAVRELARRFEMDPEAVEDFFREVSEEQSHSSLVNIRGERLVLAGMLLDEEFAGTALLSLDERAFHLVRHRRLFAAIRRLFTTRDAVNEDTVATYLVNQGDEKLAAYARSLLDADDPESRAFMLGDLKDKSIRREVRRHAQDAILRLGDTSNSAKTLIHALSGSLALATVSNTTALKTTDTVVREQMAVVMDRVRNPSLITGIDLGADWMKVNHTLRGLQRKRLIVIAAPTTVGKTAIAGCWFKIAAVDRQEPSIYLTFETGDDVLFERLVSNMSGVESDKIATGYMTGEELERVQDAAAQLAASPGIITRAGQTLQEGISVVRHDRLVRGTRLAIFDQANLMRIDGWRDRRDLELTEIANQLLGLANDEDMTIVLLAQINRAGSQKTKLGGSATMEDTGESYGIAQAADAYVVVRFKTRDEIDADGLAAGNRAGLIDKNRGGRRGVGFDVVADEATSHYREAKEDDRVPDRPAGGGQDGSSEAAGGAAGGGDGERRRRRPEAGGGGRRGAARAVRR